ncbi:hypothetical protein [Conchiformibius kuhniae]|uniref:Uncharacterized protein n=1 Tax=Conchiformibius kuhniae TaxID=211502 RepID=A0ABD8B7K2_9NEIS|nr:hypothetical protein [Conchiformibius kuhniae]
MNDDAKNGDIWHRNCLLSERIGAVSGRMPVKTAGRDALPQERTKHYGSQKEIFYAEAFGAAVGHDGLGGGEYRAGCHARQQSVCGAVRASAFAHYPNHPFEWHGRETQCGVAD